MFGFPAVQTDDPNGVGVEAVVHEENCLTLSMRGVNKQRGSEFMDHRTPKNRRAPRVAQMMPPQKTTLASANTKKNAAILRKALTIKSERRRDPKV